MPLNIEENEPIFIGSLKFSKAYQTVLHILPINSLKRIIFLKIRPPNPAISLVITFYFWGTPTHEKPIQYPLVIRK
jgi:hypothetical protein